LKRLASALALTLLAALPLAADTYTIDKSHSETTFQVRHLLTKLSGKFDDYSGTININKARPAASTVEFRIKAASINTGEADRDKHLRGADFFDADKFPEIVFKSTRVVAAGKDQYKVTGNLTMHGVTKTITIPVNVLGFAKDPWGNDKAGFELTTKLNRKDYGVNWNKALDNGGMLVGDEVTININLETVKAKG
jgi:polyisoprenoid-binding protein YceI